MTSALFCSLSLSTLLEEQATSDKVKIIKNIFFFLFPSVYVVLVDKKAREFILLYYLYESVDHAPIISAGIKHNLL